MTRSPFSPAASAPVPAPSTLRARARTLPLALPLVLLAACGHGLGHSGGSTPVVVTGPAPYFVVQPTNETVAAGSAATLSAQATSGATYQWYKNGTGITGATGPTYTIAASALTDADTYYVVATYNNASTRSALAPLVVNAAAASAPVLTAQPANLAVAGGGTATFSVTATNPGTDTLGYQWTKDGVGIAGATAATLTVASATSANAGNYAVQVTNAAGTTSSSIAQLAVLPSTTASACDPTYVNNVISQLNALQTAIGTSAVSALQYLPTTYSTAQLNGVKTSWAVL